MSELSPEGWRDIAAMNAGTYKMSEEGREQWYRDHPVSEFAYPSSSAFGLADAKEEIKTLHDKLDEALQRIAVLDGRLHDHIQADPHPWGHDA